MYERCRFQPAKLQVPLPDLHCLTEIAVHCPNFLRPYPEYLLWLDRLLLLQQQRKHFVLRASFRDYQGKPVPEHQIILDYTGPRDNEVATATTRTLQRTMLQSHHHLPHTDTQFLQARCFAGGLGGDGAERSRLTRADAQCAPQSKLPLANSRPIVNLYVSHLTEICGLHYRLAEWLKLHWSFSFPFMIYQTKK